MSGGDDRFAGGRKETSPAFKMGEKSSREKERGRRVQKLDGRRNRNSSSPVGDSYFVNSEQKDRRGSKDDDKRVYSPRVGHKEKRQGMEDRARKYKKSRSEESDYDERNGRHREKRKREEDRKDGRSLTPSHNDEDTKEERARKLGRESDSSSSSDERNEDEESDHGEMKSKVHRRHKHGKHSERKTRKKTQHRREQAENEESCTSESDGVSTSDSEISDSEDEARREKERRRRKRRRRKRKEKELEKEAQRKLKKKKKELREKELKAELKTKKEMRSKKAITTSWGKYGIVKDIDMWNKRPEFSAWLGEVKKVNMETLTNWEEKQMFKEYMEDFNTGTMPSKKPLLSAKDDEGKDEGLANLKDVERTDFNDEDDRRLELQKEREKQKEAELQALMRKMQSGMAQDMREQAQLREEMQYQFRLGNIEAAQAIQRRLDPDAEKFGK